MPMRAGRASASRPRPSGRRRRGREAASSSICRARCGSGPRRTSTAIPASFRSRTPSTPRSSSARSTACSAAARGSPTRSSPERRSATGTTRSAGRSSPASAAPRMPELSRIATPPRIRIERLLDEADRTSALYDATFWSLRETPKALPAVWLYDERGSGLFEEITRLPEYYLTRAEREILLEHAAEIAAATAAATLVELGSGTSEKTTILLDALAAAETLERFVPVDVSEEVLRASAHAVSDRYPRIGVHAIVGDFERHLAAVPTGGRRLVAFLGSTIGNLQADGRARLLGRIASTLEPEDAFLLGVDLVKDPARLEAAYNDGAGVTESFVRNGLTAVNRELRASFDRRLLAFSAFWDAAHEWMDIGFHASRAHSVCVEELECVVPLAQGERLRLEVSAKFRRESIARELADAGLRLTAWWTDDRGDFALLLASRTPH